MKKSTFWFVLAFLLWPLMTGLLVGTGHYAVAAAWSLLTPLVGIVAFALGYERACKDPPAERAYMLNLINQ